MRKEISESKQWRSRGSRINSWNRPASTEELSADVVDAAFEENAVVAPMRSSRRDRVAESKPDQKDIIQSLSAQLEMLEAQRNQIQRLLDQAQG